MFPVISYRLSVIGEEVGEDRSVLVVGMSVVVIMGMPAVVGMIVAVPVVVGEMEGVGGVVGDLLVDFAQGGAVLLGGGAAVFVFGEDLGLAVGELGYFDADAAEGGFDSFDAAWERIALHGGVTDAEGGACVEEDVLESIGVGWFGEDLEKDAGAAFFHLGGNCADVESAGFHEFAGEVAGEFGRFVIDVRFEHGERLSDDAGSAGGVAEEDAEDVGDDHVAGAGAVAEVLDMLPGAVGHDFGIAAADTGVDPNSVSISATQQSMSR